MKQMEMQISDVWSRLGCFWANPFRVAHEETETNKS